MQFEEKTIHRKEIFKGHIFDVVVDDVELPNGLGQAKRELIFHKGAVCVLAVTPEDKLILEVKLVAKKQPLCVNWKRKLVIHQIL